jgi:uncharacterized protein
MSHLRRWLLKWARSAHLYVTLFGLALLLFFSVTGFMLNHEDWFVAAEPQTRTTEGKIAVELLGAPGKEGEEGSEPIAPVPADRLAIVELLRKDFGAVGAMSSFEEQDDIRVVFKRPGTEVEAEIKREDGKTEVTTRTHGPVGMMLDLHRGKASGEAWSLVIDGVCVLVLIVSGTGLYLWQSLRGRGHYGIYVLGLGAALGVAVYLLFVP